MDTGDPGGRDPASLAGSPPPSGRLLDESLLLAPPATGAIPISRKVWPNCWITPSLNPENARGVSMGVKYMSPELPASVGFSMARTSGDRGSLAGAVACIT